MFRSLRSVLRTVRLAVFPFTRTAMLVLAWANRHTVALWFRSLRHEVSTVGFEPSRMRRLLQGLWAVSSDRRTANAAPLRKISVRGDGFGVEAREGWVGRATVEHLLSRVGSRSTTMSVA